MSYKHGIYGIAEVTNSATDVAKGTVPAYIGTLPIHRINTKGAPDFDYTPYINKPILISSLRQVQEMGLYSDDWETYTLCEAIHAHFMNGAQAVGPIVLMNTKDPSSVEKSPQTLAVTMKKSGTRYVGYINRPLCVLEDAAVESAEDITNFDFRYDGDTVVIEVVAPDCEAATISVDFVANDMVATEVTESNVNEALSNLDYCEQLVGYIPNIVAAPGISEVPDLHSLMIQKAMDKISGKWNFVVLSDIPNTEDTYGKAAKWKQDNAYDSKYEKVFWPAVAHGDKVYHLSTIGAYMMQSIDMQNGDVPYVSTSNKALFCDRAVANGNTFLVSEAEANQLNEKGITTVNSVKRTLRLWGAHMANYDHSKLSAIAAEDRFDSSVRMSMYLLNYLQYQYINEIDQAFTRKDIDSIVNDVQNWLDSLVADGMLLYARIDFNNESNSDAAIANGDFVFDLEVTYGVTAKSITFKLQYTSAGLVAITTDGGDE